METDLRQTDTHTQRRRAIEACLAEGGGLPEAATRVGLTLSGLRSWLCQNAPELYERTARTYRKKDEWPEAALALLTACHAGGVSASETARRINAKFDLGVTKPTVQFRAETLGLGGFGKVATKRTEPAPLPAADEGKLWTPERIQRLGELDRQGLSRAQIAATLSAETGRHFSRNAITGKLVRDFPCAAKPLGRPSEAVSRARSRVRTQRPAAAPAPLAVIMPEPRRSIPAPEPLRLKFLDLGPGQCFWPLSIDEGDAMTRQPTEETFCGAACAGRYCESHRARVWNPAPRRRNSEADAARSEIRSQRMKRYWAQRVRSRGGAA